MTLRSSLSCLRAVLPSSALLTWSGAVLAAAPPPPAFAPAGNGQSGLAVGSDQYGAMRAKLCAASCDIKDGVDIGVPKELWGQTSKARLSLVGIGNKRRAIVVSVPGAANGQSFEAVIAAPLTGDQPRVVFAGLTGLVEGPDGARQGKQVQISEPDEDGARSILVGEAREDLDLCGRRALLSPQVLNPADLTLRSARVQRLSAAEREQAERLTAQRAAEGAPAATPGVVRALGASSAVGNPGGLTDGKLETAWIEARGGAGRGEFAMLSAPPELSLTGFELVVRPNAALSAKAAVPRELWVASRTQVFQVTLPNEAQQAAGARYRVTLPKPIRTDCLGVVMESAFNERADSEVGIVEFSATTELGESDAAALAAALAGGQERSKAAGAVLRALGAPGFAEVAKAFDKLDEGGRRVALDVIDAAPCETSGPVYLSALLGSFEAQRTHAQDRLMRCGRASAPLLEQRFPLTQGGGALVIANALALAAPERAVASITARVVSSPTRERRALRVILARAVTEEAAKPTVQQLLRDANLPAAALLELLRALGPRVTSFPTEAHDAVQRLRADTSFRTRYLLLGPAAVLAPTDADARSIVEQAARDASEARLRARAFELMPRDARAAELLVLGLRDPDVRVREAATLAVRDARVGNTTKALARLLDKDAWPLVRTAAAEAFAALPSEPSGNTALLDALDDASPAVRSAVSTALGTRRVGEAKEPLRERLEDDQERFDVRRAAAAALASLCDQDSVDTLTKLARKLSDPMATAEQRALGEAALQALAALAPSDLKKRLEPLRTSRAAKAAEAAERDAQKSDCRARGK